jgi:hypothetical protein
LTTPVCYALRRIKIQASALLSTGACGMSGRRRQRASTLRLPSLLRAVAILNIGRQDAHAEQERERIEKDMALAPGDFLARVKPLRINRHAPYCAALALRLSITAVVGLASLPAASRTAT